MPGSRTEPRARADLTVGTHRRNGAHPPDRASGAASVLNSLNSSRTSWNASTSSTAVVLRKPRIADRRDPGPRRARTEVLVALRQCAPLHIAWSSLISCTRAASSRPGWQLLPQLLGPPDDEAAEMAITFPGLDRELEAATAGRCCCSSATRSSVTPGGLYVLIPSADLAEHRYDRALAGCGSIRVTLAMPFRGPSLRDPRHSETVDTGHNRSCDRSLFGPASLRSHGGVVSGEQRRHCVGMNALMPSPLK